MENEKVVKDKLYGGLTQSEYEEVTKPIIATVIEIPCSSNEDFENYLNSLVAKGYKIISHRNGNLCKEDSPFLKNLIENQWK